MGTSLDFTNENFNLVVELLGFYNTKNPNGKDCYNIHDPTNGVTLEYTGKDGKERMYYFLFGILYERRKHENGK